MLAVAIAVVVMALALPLKIFLSQRAQVSSLQSQNAAAQVAITSLRNQLAEWSSPPYIEAQARARLHMMLPGQRAYIVLGGRTEANAEQAAPTAGRSAGVRRTWFDQLWVSTVAAGNAHRAHGG